MSEGLIIIVGGMMLVIAGMGFGWGKRRSQQRPDESNHGAAASATPPDVGATALESRSPADRTSVQVMAPGRVEAAPSSTVRGAGKHRSGGELHTLLPDLDRFLDVDVTDGPVSPALLDTSQRLGDDPTRAALVVREWLSADRKTKGSDSTFDATTGM